MRHVLKVMCAAGLVWLAAGPARADEAPLRFGSGSKGGNFALLGQALQAEIAGGDTAVRIVSEETKGSCENIRRLLEGTLDLALVQYDVAAEAFRASVAEIPEGQEDAFGGWMCKISPHMAHGAELRVVSAISDSAVHMLVRRPVRLDDFATIGDRGVFIGKDGSGSFETAKVILGAGGRPIDGVNLFGGSADESLLAMGRGEVLMMLRTTDPGHPDITKVLDSGLAALGPLPEDVLNRLIDGYPYYRVCPIEPRHYPGKLEYSLPTVCVTSVVLSALPRAKWDDEAARTRQDAAAHAVLDGLARVAKDPQYKALGLDLRYRDFAEKEPIPLHRVSADRESWENWVGRLELLGGLLAVVVAMLLIRRALRRRGIGGLASGFEGQLANPLVPFGAFALTVLLSTYLVWFLEHDSNTKLRTLNDSFWEMNTFATGNFNAETLKTSTARVVGAAATIIGLGLLAWFTATLTNIFAQDQTRLWRRLRGHLVVLNFREDMLPLIRLLRSPGPSRLRSLHVVVPDALPKRVRLQLGKIKSLTIHYDNPEVPENLAALRLPRASRVIVLGGEADKSGTSYDPLRIARAVHQACARDPLSLAAQGRTGHASTAISVAATMHAPIVAMPVLPVTLVEASEDEPGEIFEPFSAWLLPVDSKQLAFTWISTACRDPAFAEFFSGVVAFSDANAELYSHPLPTWCHGQPWRVVRRALYGLVPPGSERGGVIPLGLYRASTSAGPGKPYSAHVDLRTRLLVNPAPTTTVAAGDLVIALCEDEGALGQALRAIRPPT